MLPLSASESEIRPSRLPRTFRALRHLNFRLYWFGQIISQAGSWMQIVAQGWLVYRLTDSPFLLGLVNFVGLIPVIPLSLLAGVISDRFPRRTIILITESILMLQASVFALLTWLNLIQVWHIILLSFIQGAASALEQPARLAFVVDTVGEEDLTNAVALNASVYNSARIVGPSIAGFLVAWVGEEGCFLLNGVSFLAVILALLAMRLPSYVKPTTKMQVGGSLMKGFSYMWETDVIRGLLIIVGVSSFFTLPYLALMPVFAKDVLSVGPEGLGFLMTATGVGAIIGALFVASIHEGRRGIWLTVGNALAPAILVLFAVSRSFYISLALVALVGLSNAIRQTLANSLLQLSANEEYHGRVMSIFNLLNGGMSRFGALGVGALAQVTNAPLAYSASAISSLILGLLIVWRMPHLYHLD
jgi:MFS family permease